MWKKSQKSADSPRSLPVYQKNTPWHAVSVVTTNASCNEARLLGRERFLSRDAPRLPLPQCGHPQSCPCAYKHHADRRRDPRRSEELIGIRRGNYVAPERRQLRGRRETD
jgi:hypothetical protein